MFLESTSPDEDPVAYRIDGDPTYQDVIIETHDVHVPVEDCSDNDDLGCCGDCSTGRTMRGDLALIPLVIALVLRRRRRR